MWLELNIARKISASSSGKGKSPAHKVAVVAVALSVAVMLCSVAIVGGFKDEIRKKLKSFNPDITLYASAQNLDSSDTLDNVITLDDNTRHFLNSLPDVKSYSLSISVPVLLKSRDSFKGLYLHGVDSTYNWEAFRDNIITGSVPNQNHENDILISASASNKLGLSLGDTINTYYMGDDIRVRPLKVCGIFDSHFEAYDDILAFSSIKLARAFTSLEDNQGSMIEITAPDSDNIPAVASSIIRTANEAQNKGELSQGFDTTTIYDQGANFFSWLELLDTNVAVILALMVIVSAFTLVSAMLIIILERMRFIGIMKSLGLSSSNIRKIFRCLALRIAAVGLLYGNIVALCILLTQYFLHIIPLNPSAYYMDYVPVRPDFLTWVIIDVAFVAIIYLVLILPSQVIARVSPAKSMRYD